MTPVRGGGARFAPDGDLPIAEEVPDSPYLGRDATAEEWAAWVAGDQAGLPPWAPPERHCGRFEQQPGDSQ